MVSAHWETPGTFMVMSTPKPPMVYDYYGFPAHTYEIQYPAPGAPALADRVQQLLQTAGLPIVQESQRGFDHGAFVPAYVLYTNADVPRVQLSIAANLYPKHNLAPALALLPLRPQQPIINDLGICT